MSKHYPLFDSIGDVGEGVDAPSYYDPCVSAGRREKDAGKRNRNDVYVETLPRHASDRERVLAYLRTIGWRGATRDEVAHVLGMQLSTVCGRMRELIDQEQVIETDERRATRTGASAVVVRWAFAR